MSQTVITKKSKAKKPQDHQPPKAKASTPAPSGIIDIEDEEEGIPVRLVGVDYVAHRPKALMAVRLGEQIKGVDMEDVEAVVDLLSRFLRLMFGSTTTVDIMARLDDEDDRLDVVHLFTLVEKMTAEVSNRPPTSSPASDN